MGVCVQVCTTAGTVTLSTGAETEAEVMTSVCITAKVVTLDADRTYSDNDKTVYDCRGDDYGRWSIEVHAQ